MTFHFAMIDCQYDVFENFYFKLTRKKKMWNAQNFIYAFFRQTMCWHFIKIYIFQYWWRNVKQYARWKTRSFFRFFIIKNANKIVSFELTWLWISKMIIWFFVISKFEWLTMFSWSKMKTTKISLTTTNFFFFIIIDTFFSNVLFQIMNHIHQLCKIFANI